MNLIRHFITKVNTQLVDVHIIMNLFSVCCWNVGGMRYEEERKDLTSALKKAKLSTTIGNIRGHTSEGIYTYLIRYLKKTGLIERI